MLNPRDFKIEITKEGPVYAPWQVTISNFACRLVYWRATRQEAREVAKRASKIPIRKLR